MAKIMIVDDSPGLAKSFRSLLELDGHRVLTYEFPEHALYQFCEVHPVDVVLCDLQMPGLSGPEFLEGLNGMLTPDQRPVYVGMTGHAGRREIGRMRDAGAVAVLDKPFSPQQFYRAAGLRVAREATVPELAFVSLLASTIIYKPSD